MATDEETKTKKEPALRTPRATLADRLLVPPDIAGNGRRGRPKGSRNKPKRRSPRRPNPDGILAVIIPMLKILGQTEIKLTQLEELLSLGK